MRAVKIAEEVTAAVRVLSRHRIGALVLLEPSSEITGGVLLDAVVSRGLLVSLVVPEYLNSLHRGAVVIRDDRVERAGVPVAWAEVLERAAELASGAAIAVEEVTGKIRIADQTGRVTPIDGDELVVALRRHALELHRR